MIVTEWGGKFCSCKVLKKKEVLVGQGKEVKVINTWLKNPSVDYDLPLKKIKSIPL